MEEQILYTIGVYIVCKLFITMINCVSLDFKISRRVQKISYGVIGFLMTQAFCIFS